MLAEVLAVDTVREAMLLTGVLSPLDLLRIRRVAAPLRELATSALAEYTPLAMLGALDTISTHSPRLHRRQVGPSQLVQLAGDGSGDDDDDGDDDFVAPSSEEDEDHGGEEATSDMEATDGDSDADSDTAADSDDDSGGGGGDGGENFDENDDDSDIGEVVPLRIQGFVMNWSSGRWAASPAVDCRAYQPSLMDRRQVQQPCRVLGTGMAVRGSSHWPPKHTGCLVLPHSCDWAADYSLTMTAGATHVECTPLLHEPCRGTRTNGAAVLCGSMPTEQGEGGRAVFMLGGYYEPPWGDLDDDEELDEEEDEEGHSALVEYFPIDAANERCRRWTALQPMECRRTEFAAGFFPAGAYLAEDAQRRSGRASSHTAAAAALIVAGGSDGSNEEYLRTAECLCVVGPGELSCGDWSRLPDMLHPRGYCTGCVLPDGRFVVMGGRSRRSTGPARRRDGEVFDPWAYKWRALPPLPAVFGESPELTLCAGGPSLVVAAMVVPEEIGGKRYVAALQLEAPRAHIQHEICEEEDCENEWWRDQVAQAAAAERWVTLRALPQGSEAEHAKSLVCLARGV
jgi:hypothetical protein